MSDNEAKVPEPGDEVQVSNVWAGGGYARKPLKAWFPGYRFVRREGDYGVVRAIQGLYADADQRYSMSDIRVGGKPYEDDKR